MNLTSSKEGKKIVTEQSLMSYQISILNIDILK